MASWSRRTPLETFRKKGLDTTLIPYTTFDNISTERGGKLLIRETREDFPLEAYFGAQEYYGGSA